MNQRWWRMGLSVAASFVALGLAWRFLPFGPRHLATFDPNWDRIRVDIDCDGAGAHARVRGELGSSSWFFDRLEASVEGQTLVLRVYQRLVGLGGSSSSFDVVVPAGSAPPKNVISLNDRGTRHAVRAWI